MAMFMGFVLVLVGMIMMLAGGQSAPEIPREETAMVVFVSGIIALLGFLCILYADYFHHMEGFEGINKFAMWGIAVVLFLEFIFIAPFIPKIIAEMNKIPETPKVKSFNSRYKRRDPSRRV